MNDYAKNPSAIQELTPRQYQVTQPCATEPPLLNEFWDETRAGICVDIVAGEPLFASIDTYDSNTGWPSFTVPLEPDVVVQVHDHTLGMVRTELRSAHGDNYLRHAFDDGPMAQGSLRYCINSAYLPSSTDCEVSHDLCA